MLKPTTSNRVTNHIISEINRLTKSKERSELELKRYQVMIDSIKHYGKERFDTEFAVSHVTMNALKGKVQKGEEKIRLLQNCLTIEDYSRIKETE